MSKRNQLPDSLELLLDTMCNTFGAIMFIAMSLVVISQVTTKMVRDMRSPEVTEEYLEQMRQKMRALEEELAEEERMMAEKALAALGMPKEKKEKVEKLLAAKAENQRLILDLSRQLDEKMKMESELNNAKQDVENAKGEMARLEVETTLKERALAQELQENRRRKEELERQIEEARKEVADEKRTLENTSGQTLTFSMEVSTAGERQYTICLRNGRLFREAAGEIEAVRDSGTSGHFAFSGTGHPISGEGEIRQLLGGVGQGRFVTVFCDKASYDELVALRKYFRSRKIKMNFNYTDNWGFSFGGDIKASY